MPYVYVWVPMALLLVNVLWLVYLYAKMKRLSILAPAFIRAMVAVAYGLTLYFELNKVPIDALQQVLRLTFCLLIITDIASSVSSQLIFKRGNQL